MSNPAFLTVDDYMYILTSAVKEALGKSAEKPMHPEDIGAAVDNANDVFSVALSIYIKNRKVGFIDAG